MRAIDTNIIVRLMARDDEAQFRSAEAILDEPFLILPTVLLETVWVLRTSFKLAPSEIAARLRLLLGSANAQIQSGEAILWALSHLEHGADFGDMVHLALAHEAEADQFTTFNKKPARASVFDLDITIEQLG